jgi:hypothetical protein
LDVMLEFCTLYRQILENGNFQLKYMSWNY